MNNQNKSIFIVNETKKNFINLKKIVDDNAIREICYFVLNNEIWDKTDSVFSSVKAENFIYTGYNDISFIFNLYSKNTKAKAFLNKTKYKRQASYFQ